ncbi:hypothetical protein CGI50_21540 [Vibrio parahaemolyticus]|nr:hypothetical protein CGI50_21540 [Vibrio parahaemolyticus]TON66258.1 hypothetical protein CGH53_20630 [Vibrio parahaemolyticus]
MTEKSFLIEHGASIIAVSASLLTAIVTLSFNWFSKVTDHTFQEKKKLSREKWNSKTTMS